MTAYRNAQNSLLLTAGYREDGLRAWKEDADENRTYFLYGGDTIICELNSSGQVSAFNTWGPTGLLNRTTLKTGGAVDRETWYGCDPLGNVGVRTDAASKVISVDRYDAWGNLLVGGDATDPYGYKGQYGYYTDHETGLILCTHRYYDPMAGRWLTEDPIGYLGGLNLYAYCGGDPVGEIDPIGFCGGDFWNNDHFSGKAAIASVAGSTLAVVCVAFPPVGAVVAVAGTAYISYQLGTNLYNDGFNIANALDDTFLKPLENPYTFGFTIGGIATAPVAAATTGLPGAFMPGGMWRGGAAAADTAADTAGTGGLKKFWSAPIQFKGVKVYQRNDIIDPNLVDARGRTNLQRMGKGLAPIGPDGNPVNLHHMTQSNDSAIAEVTQSFHQQNSKTIHINPNTIPSGIDRGLFNTWKSNYWINRANDFK